MCSYTGHTRAVGRPTPSLGCSAESCPGKETQGSALFHQHQCCGEGLKSAMEFKQLCELRRGPILPALWGTQRCNFQHLEGRKMGDHGIGCKRWGLPRGGVLTPMSPMRKQSQGGAGDLDRGPRAALWEPGLTATSGQNQNKPPTLHLCNFTRNCTA